MNMSSLGTLSGKTITVRIGTVCSGSELLLTVLPHLCSSFEAATGYKLVFDHQWSCEMVPNKCEWIAANFPSVKAIFCDVTKLSDPEGALDYLTNELKKPTEVDVCVGGTSCKDASRMNVHQQDRRNSIETKSHTTGSDLDE